MGRPAFPIPLLSLSLANPRHSQTGKDIAPRRRTRDIASTTPTALTELFRIFPSFSAREHHTVAYPHVGERSATSRVSVALGLPSVAVASDPVPTVVVVD